MISFSDTVAWLSDDLSARVVVQHSRAVVQHLMKNSLISFLKVQKKIMATKDITAIKMELRIVRETSFPEPSAVSLLAIDNLSGVTAVVFI